MFDVAKADGALLEMTLLELSLTIVALLAATSAVLWSYRNRLYRDLSARQRSIVQEGSATGGGGWLNQQPTLPSFTDRLAVFAEPLPPEQFRPIAREIEALAGTERSYLPTHKKGGTVAYETLCVAAPSVVALYLSPQFQQLVSGIVGEQVQPTPLHDQSSCSALFYERPGDHIGWHYDHNFYKGRHFTVLIAIVNRNTTDTGVSAARLIARIGEEDRQVATPPNTMVVFEGARVLHKATPIGEGERRIMLSMTFCTDPRNSMLQGIVRRIKDTAFFGIRALWT